MIVVVGGGPAGRYAAMRLAAAGKEVRLVDKRSAGLGGQCLHEGCMVICALNDVARLLDQTKSFNKMGFLNLPTGFSYPILKSRMEEIIREIAGILDKETKDAGVSVIFGTAELKGSSLFIDGVNTPAEAVVIATGAHPYIPDIPGSFFPGVYTAHTILSMKDLPDNMVIIGSGVIAAEYAYIFSNFGVKVTILARSTFLRALPGPLVDEARKQLSDVVIIENATAREIKGNSEVSGVLINDSEGTREIKTDVVLLAAGMVPNTGFISGIALGKDGSLLVNELMETSVPGVYAAGDVTGFSHLTPIARFMGRRAADTILGRISASEPLTVPQAIKLRHDLAFCSNPGIDGKGISIPGPAGPGTFWQVPARQTGFSMVGFDKNNKIISLSEASPSASVAMAYLGWVINSGIEIEAFEKFIEVHPSSDGIPWLLKYMNGKKGMTE